MAGIETLDCLHSISGPLIRPTNDQVALQDRTQPQTGVEQMSGEIELAAVWAPAGIGVENIVPKLSLVEIPSTVHLFGYITGPLFGAQSSAGTGRTPNVNPLGDALGSVPLSQSQLTWLEGGESAKLVRGGVDNIPKRLEGAPAILGHHFLGPSGPVDARFTFLERRGARSDALGCPGAGARKVLVIPRSVAGTVNEETEPEAENRQGGARD